MLSHHQLREVFHFCFLERLGRIAAPQQFVLKGGVNLRFFFHSPRYSEDMDLDVRSGSVGTLKKNGYKILQDAAFGRLLKTYGIEALDLNDPDKAKQTETTQRFRLGLVTTAGERLPTKVEFSRRKGSKTFLTAPIDPEIARRYNRISFSFPHYSGESMVSQKIKALADRPKTQARDVFDLHLLFLAGFAGKKPPHPVPIQIRKKARENLRSLRWTDYEGQVLEFLEDDARKAYGIRGKWDEIRETVLGMLDNGL